VFYDPQNPPALGSAREAREAARGLGLEIVEKHVGSVSELQRALKGRKRDKADAVLAI
jgi:ABC-type uncharacterized transport system substrate-binding protein